MTFVMAWLPVRENGEAEGRTHRAGARHADEREFLERSAMPAPATATFDLLTRGLVVLTRMLVGRIGGGE